jgi:hypothetical protein
MSLLLLVCSGLLSWRDAEFCQRPFLLSIEMTVWFLSLILFMSCISYIDLYTLNHPCIPGLKAIWLQCKIFLMCCWIQFGSTAFRILTFYVHQGNWVCSFLFLLCPYPLLWRVGVSSSVKDGRIQQWIHLVLGFSLLGHSLFHCYRSIYVVYNLLVQFW